MISEHTSQKEFLRAHILGETNDLKAKFVTLVFQLQKKLEKANVPHSDVINILSCMDIKFKDVLKDSKTLADIFSAMNRYWSFYDYILIKLIINNVGDTAMKDSLKVYIDCIRKYCKNRLSDCPLNSFGDDENRPSEQVIIKIDEDLKNLNVREMSKLRNEIIKHIGIKYVRLLSVDEGCVRLTLRSLPLVSDTEFRLSSEQQRLLHSLNVLNIEVCGIKIFHQHAISLSEDKAENNLIDIIKNEGT